MARPSTRSERAQPSHGESGCDLLTACVPADEVVLRVVAALGRGRLGDERLALRQDGPDGLFVEQVGERQHGVVPLLQLGENALLGLVEHGRSALEVAPRPPVAEHAVVELVRGDDPLVLDCLRTLNEPFPAPQAPRDAGRAFDELCPLTVHRRPKLAMWWEVRHRVVYRLGVNLRTAPRAAYVHARRAGGALKRAAATEADRLASRRGRADVSVFHDFAPPPSGGGNQFLAGLVGELRRRGLEVEVNRISGGTPVCLFNSFNFDDRRLRRFARDGCRMVHRVDGPIGVYRGFDDGTDRHIYELNGELAQTRRSSSPATAWRSTASWGWSCAIRS